MRLDRRQPLRPLVLALVILAVPVGTADVARSGGFPSSCEREKEILVDGRLSCTVADQCLRDEGCFGEINAQGSGVGIARLSVEENGKKLFGCDVVAVISCAVTALLIMAPGEERTVTCAVTGSAFQAKVACNVLVFQ